MKNTEYKKGDWYEYLGMRVAVVGTDSNYGVTVQWWGPDATLREMTIPEKYLDMLIPFVERTVKNEKCCDTQGRSGV